MYKTPLLISVLAAPSFGSTASAENYFSCMSPLERGTSLELGLVRSDAAGIVEVYDYRLGEQGELLGTVDVNEGANDNVRVSVDLPLNGDVQAMLKIDGAVVATKVYDVCDG